MNAEPRRWRAQGPGATDEIDELLRSASPARAMTAAERAAGARRVAAIAHGPAVLGARVALRGLALGGAAIVVAVVVAVLVLVHARRAPHHPAVVFAHRDAVTPAVAPPRAVAPSIVPTPGPVTAAPSLAPGRAPRIAAPRAVTAPAPLAASSSGDLEREDALLLDAHRLVATDPAGALASIAAYDAQCPRRQLVQERDAIEIAALVALGRTDAARARAAQALAHDHGSAYRLRIERLLAAAPARDP